MSGLPFSASTLQAVPANCPKMRHLGIGYSGQMPEGVSIHPLITSSIRP